MKHDFKMPLLVPWPPSKLAIIAESFYNLKCR